MQRILASVAVAIVLSSPSLAVDVSVCGDATYKLPADRGEICASADPVPSGTACPLKGDPASADCVEGLLSYADDGSCKAPEDAVCALVVDTTWGCVFPSIGCGGKALATTSPALKECETWDYDEKEDASGSNIDDFSLFDGNEDYDEKWFVEVTKVTVLFACGADTKPTAAPTAEPTPAATSDTEDESVSADIGPKPTPAATSDTEDAESASVDTEQSKPTPAATTDAKKASGSTDTEAKTAASPDAEQSSPDSTQNQVDSPSTEDLTSDSAAGATTGSSEDSWTESERMVDFPSEVQQEPEHSMPADWYFGEEDRSKTKATTTDNEMSAAEATTPPKRSTGFTGALVLSETSEVVGTLKPAEILDVTNTPKSS